MVSLTEMEYIPDTEDDEPPAYDLNICEKLGQIIVGHLTTKNVVVCPINIADWTDICLDLLPLNKDEISANWNRLLQEAQIDYCEEIVVTININFSV